MKKVIFITVLLFSLIGYSQTEDAPKVEIDSLKSKAFRFEFLECELIKKELNSTEKLLLKEEKTVSAFEKIISIQEKEQMEMLGVIENERDLKEKAYDQVDNYKKIIKKKKVGTFLKVSTAVILAAGTGYIVGSASK